MLRRMSEVDVKSCLKLVQSKVEQACLKRAPELQCIQPMLVAVSKTKSAENVMDVYEGGQQHFGENYVQEFEDKSNNPELLQRCPDIKWHFIGHLQTNKINKVLAIPNLYMIQTVHSQKLATSLNKSWPKFSKEGSKLKILIQVNTSGEEEKNGVMPSEVVDLTKYVLNDCPNLHLEGIMTIGKYGYCVEDGPNPDFLSLKACRDEICQQLGLDWKTIHLSMGMSADYEQAIELGSTIVRVGTCIFGERSKVNK